MYSTDRPGPASANEGTASDTIAAAETTARIGSLRIPGLLRSCSAEPITIRHSSGGDDGEPRGGVRGSTDGRCRVAPSGGTSLVAPVETTWWGRIPKTLCIDRCVRILHFG